MQATKEKRIKSVPQSNRKAIRSRKPKKVANRQCSKNATSIRGNRFSLINIQKLDDQRTLYEVVDQQGDDYIFSLDFLEQILLCLKNHPDWKDQNNWNGNEKPAEVITKLIQELDQLTPANHNLNYNHQTKKIELLRSFRWDSCMINVSAFLPQLKSNNKPLYDLVAPMIGHMHRVLKMELWDGVFEDQAMEHLEMCMDDPDFSGYDDNEISDGQKVLSKWKNVIVPLADECRRMAYDISIPKLYQMVEEFPWPNTFMARRIITWFKRGFTLLDHGLPLCWATPYDPEEYEDCMPITPYESFKFNWNGFIGIEDVDFVMHCVQEIYNDHWGNGGQIDLQTSQDLEKGWDINDQWFKDLESFLDASISLWQEPHIRDYYKLTSVKTKRVYKKEQYRPSYWTFEAVDYKPLIVTL